jgi:plasmid stabilization system protein ParE
VNAYALSVAAEMDLDEIWEYIANDSIEAADRWIGRLFEPSTLSLETPAWGTSGKT